MNRHNAINRIVNSPAQTASGMSAFIALNFHNCDMCEGYKLVQIEVEGRVLWLNEDQMRELAAHLIQFADLSQSIKEAK